MTSARLDPASSHSRPGPWLRVIAAPLIYLVIAQIPLYFLAAEGCRYNPGLLPHLVALAGLTLLVVGAVRPAPAGHGEDRSAALLLLVSRLLHAFFVLLTAISWLFVVLRAPCTSS
ncbi:MAG TPA: hypothetical protein VG817_10565 [Gemmatimonadales bacterium]|nr:hypothetical protein [Gemmatimonadales bacterium]